MKFIQLALVAAVCLSAAIPPTMIDAGTFTTDSGSILIGPLTSSVTHTVTYTVVFTDNPTFAPLVSGLGASIDATLTLGYTLTYGTITSTGAQSTVAPIENYARILDLRFRWVAAQG